MNEPILITGIKKFEDNRGIFYESFKENFLQKEYGITKKFVQDNHSISSIGVVRGMHYQWNSPMDKLIRVSSGKIIDKIIDIRIGSKTFGKIYEYELSDENMHQLWVPAGFAHGFISLADKTHVQYKCTELYNKDGESGINPLPYFIFSNKQLSVVTVSDKDKNLQTLEEYIKDPKF